MVKNPAAIAVLWMPLNPVIGILYPSTVRGMGLPMARTLLDTGCERRRALLAWCHCWRL
ncbi:hypothetical protein H8B02_10770 [Bradyrhizobium sp. Pear77]|nr:hypothetical protein [Bradyrhizobium altum]